MDYITRRSIAVQYGSVGRWIGGRHDRKYPCLTALGVRDPHDHAEVKAALDDLALPLQLSADPTPEGIEAELARFATSEEIWMHRSCTEEGTAS